MVDADLRSQGFYADAEAVVVEKQQSAIEDIREALAKASKTGKGKGGYPEFIITAPDTPDIVVVIECKAEVSKHESATGNKPVEFAVDGALHYARHLSAGRTVIAIAVSGTPKRHRQSFFLIPKGESEPKPLSSPTGAPISSVVPMKDLISAASFDPKVQKQRYSDLMSFSQKLHEFMRDKAELGEQEKALAVAGSLIALNNEAFAKSYQVYSRDRLPKFWMQSIKDEMAAASIPGFKSDNMTQPFTAIQVHPELSKKRDDYPKGLLNEITRRLADEVLPFMTIYHDYDVVGQFYGEFLKYSGGDGKLGVVLTPRHITELFALIANVNKDSVVVDPAAGTAGFLISSMVQMAKSATTEEQRTSIKRDRLIGIEQRPNMYALAASNMILRGDGKANLHLGSCFEPPLIKGVREHRSGDGKECLPPTVGMINPPYAKSDEDLAELRFVDNMLDMLKPGGIGLAIVPVSCATAPSSDKRTLLDKHTLEGVMSMPPELFHGSAGVITCIMVFTAGVPHATSNKKTWFGYWRNDGFVKIKNKGRGDWLDAWPAIRDRWIEAWRNREVHAGESVMATVGPDDEWVAEAYMETDYSTLTEGDFAKVMLDYALFTLSHVDETAAKESLADDQ